LASVKRYGPRVSCVHNLGIIDRRSIVNGLIFSQTYGLFSQTGNPSIDGFLCTGTLFLGWDLMGVLWDHGFFVLRNLRFASDNNPKTLGIKSCPSSEIFIVFYEYVSSSAKNACNNITMHVCESKLSTLISVGQTSVINAKQMH
jgi:hypothetical protein